MRNTTEDYDLRKPLQFSKKLMIYRKITVQNMCLKSTSKFEVLIHCGRLTRIDPPSRSTVI